MAGFETLCCKFFFIFIVAVLIVKKTIGQKFMLLAAFIVHAEGDQNSSLSSRWSDPLCGTHEAGPITFEFGSPSYMPRHYKRWIRIGNG